MMVLAMPDSALTPREKQQLVQEAVDEAMSHGARHLPLYHKKETFWQTAVKICSGLAGSLSLEARNSE